MNKYLNTLLETAKNFVFLGEAGCGKTEAAINFAVMIREAGYENVHFFDLDQTKPLFRSRDVCSLMEEKGIRVHFEEQVLDARTLVGGPKTYMNDPGSIVILDVGGDHQGSRMVGGFADLLKREDTKNYFMINSFRPWSASIEAIDRTMAGVVGMAGLGLDDISIMANPNNGLTTTVDEVVDGFEKTVDMINEYVKVESLCVMEELAGETEEKVSVPVIPIRIYMKYDWVE